MNQACLVEIQTCQLCGSQEGAEMFQDPPYRVLRCSTCDLVYVTPRHDEDALHKLYGEDYWRSNSPKTRGYACYAEEEPLYLRTFRKRPNGRNHTRKQQANPQLTSQARGLQGTPPHREKTT